MKRCAFKINSRDSYYSPSTGRFLSKDPIGFAGGDTNLYRYVNNNPINFTDPTGQFISAIVIGVGIGVAISPGLREAVGRFASESFKTVKPLITGTGKIAVGTVATAGGATLIATSLGQGPFTPIGIGVGTAGVLTGPGIIQQGATEFGQGVDNVKRVGGNIVNMCTGN